jgi:hypothetical protein
MATPGEAETKTAASCNAKMDACNWLVDDGSNHAYCAACRYNGTVPDLSDLARLIGWRELEIAKHRVFYALSRWRLPLKRGPNIPSTVRSSIFSPMTRRAADGSRRSPGAPFPFAFAA